jgi:argonaute-like protein implicated in RNA metabolism and viral defense
VDSVKDVPHARRQKTATTSTMVEKVQDLIATDARFTTRYIANALVYL